MTQTTIRIFLHDGDPAGLRLVDQSNWVGQAVVVSRSQYPDVRTRPEFERPGVYALMAPAGDEDGRPSIYIGEADILRERLNQHSKTKDFWTWLVAFSAKDLSLNKAHIRYLESRLVGLAHDAKSWNVENGNLPRPSMLSEADVADAEVFLSHMLVIYPVLGINAFEIPSKAVETGEQLLLTGPQASGVGFDEPDGFLVLEGALARVEQAPSAGAALAESRQTLVLAGLLHQEGLSYRLTQDYRFTSPSQAASILLGRRANGREEWKTADGRTLKQIQEATIG